MIRTMRLDRQHLKLLVDPADFSSGLEMAELEILRNECRRVIEAVK
jgi:hypothetical protein